MHFSGQPAKTVAGALQRSNVPTLSSRLGRWILKVVSSREFNQDVSQAKRAARVEPVFVTDRGRPTHVLMSIEAFRRLSGPAETIVDLLAAPAMLSPDLVAVADPWRRRDDDR